MIEIMDLLGYSLISKEMLLPGVIVSQIDLFSWDAIFSKDDVSKGPP